MKKKLINIAMLLNIATMLAYMAAIAYLGTFTRYMADDYCDAVITQSSSPVDAVIGRYEDGSWRAANRYSNLFFAGVVESALGSRSVSIIPVVMLILWGMGLVYLIQQARTLAGIEWHLLTDIFLAALLVFFSTLEAPNRFQTFYWRSSMVTHFAPLVFLNFLFAFLLSRIRLSRVVPISVWHSFILFIASFMIGGFSEPPVAIMVVGSGLGLVYILIFVKDKLRLPSLLLTGCVFVGAVSALAVMAFSPAITGLGEDTPSFIEWIQRTGGYTYFFLLDTLKVLPIPLFLSFICPALFIFLNSESFQGLSSISNELIKKIAIALPCLLTLLIAAGFSTSAYGQSFPVERARFFAHLLITVTLVFEGVLLGIWLSSTKWKIFNTKYVEYASILALVILAVYPFRAFLQVMQDVPEYSARAQEWDRRDAHIYVLRDLGQTDLLVPQFDGIYGVKELDSLPEHWVNRCAAAYYGVNSIRAIPIHGDEAKEEYYNNFGGYDQ